MAASTFSQTSIVTQAASWHDSLSNALFQQDYGALERPLLQLGVDLILFSGVLLVALIAYFLAKGVVFRVVTKLVRKTSNTWDDELVTSRLFNWLSMLVPGMIVWTMVPLVFRQEGYKSVGLAVSEVFIILMALFSVNSLLNLGERIYRRYEVSRQLPVKSFIQVIKIILAVCGVIFIVSSVLGKSPVLIFSGLGAMTAVLMLVFKDSLLGLVAGVQLSANRMVARGDWIEMPKFGADGEVLEVALTTVKVRNWDKTITTLPTYALISDSFKNWRGMSTSGVRRIKRAITIDVGSVKFLDEELLQKMKKIQLLQEYLEGKEEEIKAWNSSQCVTDTDTLNARAMTNLGTFRAYVVAYLRNHPQISQQETLLVRQLGPTTSGLPIEIYVFSKENAWVGFESIQSDIFDHLLALLGEFDLHAFQNPSGADFSSLSSKN